MLMGKTTVLMIRETSRMHMIIVAVNYVIKIETNDMHESNCGHNDTTFCDSKEKLLCKYSSTCCLRRIIEINLVNIISGSTANLLYNILRWETEKHTGVLSSMHTNKLKLSTCIVVFEYTVCIRILYAHSNTSLTLTQEQVNLSRS